MRLTGYYHIPGNWRMPYVAEYSAFRPLTAPSAVHLATCISIRLSAPRTLCARICCFDLRFNGLKLCSINMLSEYTVFLNLSILFWIFCFFGVTLRRYRVTVSTSGFTVSKPCSQTRNPSANTARPALRFGLRCYRNVCHWHVAFFAKFWRAICNDAITLAFYGCIRENLSLVQLIIPISITACLRKKSIHAWWHLFSWFSPV